MTFRNCEWDEIAAAFQLIGRGYLSYAPLVGVPSPTSLHLQDADLQLLIPKRPMLGGKSQRPGTPGSRWSTAASYGRGHGGSSRFRSASASEWQDGFLASRQSRTYGHATGPGHSFHTSRYRL